MTYSKEQVDALLEISEDGIWLIKGETHLNVWCRETHRLDHDQNLLPQVLPYIRPGTVVIDVGAFIGDHTIAYLKQTGPDGMVVAYEPHPVSFECLSRNCPQAVNIQSAVGQAVGKTFLNPEEGNVGASWTSPEGSLEVNMTTLDHDLSHLLTPLGRHPVSFIKIDVEGREIEVLIGATNIISQYHPAILFELNKDPLERAGHSKMEIIQFLNEFGYRTEIVSGGGWDFGCADILCL